jgi:hypothetical protein
MDESPVLFYLPEPRFGCTQQPVRKGDLLRVKSLGYGWILEGKPFLVLGVSLLWAPSNPMLGQDEVYEEVDEVHGIVDGVMRVVRVEDLELIP